MVEITELTPSDWPAVAAIYDEGIRSGHATFEVEVPNWDSWDATHLGSPRLAARSGGDVVGWAALSAVSTRPVYAGVAEVSVYVAASQRGTGIGRCLLEALVERSESSGVWTLQAGIFRENEASIALHESCGFRVVGVRERLGKHGGEWRDVMLMERRSPRVT